jgi:hypothetical protein
MMLQRPSDEHRRVNRDEHLLEHVGWRLMGHQLALVVDDPEALETLLCCSEASVRELLQALAPFGSVFLSVEVEVVDSCAGEWLRIVRAFDHASACLKRWLYASSHITRSPATAEGWTAGDGEKTQLGFARTEECSRPRMRLVFDHGTLVLVEPPDRNLDFVPGLLWDPRVALWRAPAFRYPEVVAALDSHRIPFTNQVEAGFRRPGRRARGGWDLARGGGR